MFRPAFLEYFRFLPLYAKLGLPDIEEFRVSSGQVGDYVRPPLCVEAGVALADLPDDHPGFSLHAVRKRGVGVHGMDWGQVEAKRAEVVVPAVINVGLGI
jgi:hypothetical protein